MKNVGKNQKVVKSVSFLILRYKFILPLGVLMFTK